MHKSGYGSGGMKKAGPGGMSAKSTGRGGKLPAHLDSTGNKSGARKLAPHLDAGKNNTSKGSY